MNINLSSLKNKKAVDILKVASENFSSSIVHSSSFGIEDVVIIDMFYREKINIPIITLDTGRIPQETFDLIEKIRAIYKVPVQIYFPESKDVEEFINKKGPNSFYESIQNRKDCCFIRKIKPITRALQGKKAWVTGLRASQSTTRKDLEPVEVDSNNIYKFSPLYNWSSEQVWNYIKEYKVPYNLLFDKGYTSIGCNCCTRAIKKGEDERSGRWWWEESSKKKCGLH